MTKSDYNIFIFFISLAIYKKDTLVIYIQSFVFTINKKHKKNIFILIFFFQFYIFIILVNLTANIDI